LKTSFTKAPVAQTLEMRHNLTNQRRHLMSDLTFTFFEALQAAGVPTEKAKETVETLNQSINQAIDNRYAIHARELATRGDLEKLRGELKTEIASIRTEIAPLKWGMAFIGAITLSTFIKLLLP
jgi:hypothetical protein